jgi:2,5-furandicarboxylate decarboxylase 1
MGDCLPHATEGRGHCRQGTPGPLDPSVDASVPAEKRTGSAIGIDATFPFGAEVKSAADVPVGQVCGPAVAERGHEFFEVASVPGWQDYNFPELTNRASGKPTPDAKS